MSEINIEFCAYFDDVDALRPVADAFTALAEHDFAGARERFDALGVDLAIDPERPGWDLETFLVDGPICEGMTLSPESGVLEPVALLKALTALGASLVTGSVTSETGSQRRLAYRGAKKAPAAAVTKEMRALSPMLELRDVVCSGKPAELQRLLEAGVDPNGTVRGTPLLIYALVNGNPRVVEPLLAAGADPNVSGRSGSTLLVLLLEYGPARLLPVVLAAGADPNAADGDGVIPLRAAAEGDDGTCLAFVKALVEAGARIPPDTDAAAAMLYRFVDRLTGELFNCLSAKRRKKLAVEAQAVLQLLIAAGADPALPGPTGGNLLGHVAGAPELAAFVRTLGVDTLVYPPKMYEGETYENTLLFAIHRGDLDTLTRLVGEQEFLALDASYKSYLLCDAVRSRNPPVIERLAEAGCEAAAGSERSAADLADRLGETAIANRIRELTTSAQ